jgi:hypothetical protein
LPKHLIAASVSLSLVIAPVADAAARCLSPQERTAVNVRVLQTELMVAALSCRAVPGRDFTGHYNAFIKKHGEQLVGHSRVLQGYFKATYGESSRRQLDAFITSLANDASRRSMSSSTFCDESMTLFQEASTLERRDLEKWSGLRAAVQPVAFETCGSKPKPSTTAAR